MCFEELLCWLPLTWSYIHTGNDSLVTYHFEAGGWLLADVPHSSCLGNPLIYLLPGHMSVSGIHSYSHLQHWKLGPIASSYFACNHFKLQNKLDMIFGHHVASSVYAALGEDRKLTRHLVDFELRLGAYFR